MKKILSGIDHIFQLFILWLRTWPTNLGDRIEYCFYWKTKLKINEQIRLFLLTGKIIAGRYGK